MRRSSLATTLLVLALASWMGSSSCHRPSFQLLTLGAYGGGRDGNLTSFALRLAERDHYRVLLDSGSLAPGIERHLKDPAFESVKEFFLGIETLFLTHAHLDHLTGFVTLSPALFDRQDPMRIRAHPLTLTALREHVFQSDLWPDMEEMGRVQLLPMASEAVEEDGMRFQVLPLEHPVPSFGFLVEAPNGAVFVHLGDTGPTREYHPQVRPLLLSGKLRALSLECSFPSENLDLALLTGHLTPDLVLRQLVDLATGAEFPPGSQIPQVYLQQTTRAFQGIPLILQHLKPDDEETIRKEITQLRRLGLDLRIPRQGEELCF